ncbi:MAG: hypothetical protein JNK79_00780 [Chitinophagaceae bacterium]|nr:hypothetical protein [Chitinophagaceae bacterium]
MHLQQAVNNVFVQLSETIRQLSPSQYTQHCVNLGNNTIGQHVRHIIELFQCLENGYADSSVNYEKRKRDVTIETNRDLALQLLQNIYTGLNRPDKELVLHASYDEHSEEPIVISTNYFREVAYNLEHTIHHMALIRVGIKEVSDITLPEEFGVASSTVKHRKQCAQ